MSDFRFGEVTMLHALWLLPALAALMIYAARRRRSALRMFVESGLLRRLGDSSLPDPARRVLKAGLVLAAIGCLVLALARPAWDASREEVSQSGRDVVFLLDVSRSMLAEDLRPNRLERAKLAILDVVDRLEGDRVGLAVFAGATVVKCPLTVDYAFFRMALEDVSPFSVSRGGSLIGDALRTVADDMFDGKRSNYRDVVLITDGEDHESFPAEAAAEVGELGVRLIAIGLGDERVGQRIPVPADGQAAFAGTRADRGFVRHEGQEVWSRLDADTLRRMADATPGGIYLNVATGAIDLGDVYRRLVATADAREIGSRTVERLEERFQLFLALCLLLLALETALRDRKRSAAGVRAAAWMLAVAIGAPTAEAASVRGLVKEGNQSFRAEEYEDALRSYGEALDIDPDSPYASLNRANALYRSGKFAEAAEGYTQAVRKSLEHGMPGLQATGLHSLGNALYRQAEQVAPTNPEQAMDFLAPAARSYLDALRTDRGRSDSAHNLELARRLMQRLREQASQQPQSGGQQGEQEESDQEREGDSMQQAAADQQELADESEDLQRERQQNPDADSREQQRQRAGDLADRQEDLNERTRQLARNADPQTQERLQDAARDQQQAQQDLDRDRPGDAAEAQRRAAEALREAAEQQAGQEQQPEQAQAPQADAAAETGEQQSEQEQRMTVDQILAKEKQDRQRRQVEARIGVVAVEKDW